MRGVRPYGRDFEEEEICLSYPLGDGVCGKRPYKRAFLWEKVLLDFAVDVIQVKGNVS